MRENSQSGNIPTSYKLGVDGISNRSDRFHEGYFVAPMVFFGATSTWFVTD